MAKKSKPKFNVQNLGFRKKVKDRWRKPRGVGNKKRRKEWWAGASPRVGYKNAPQERGLHPSGLPEMLVTNPAELRGVSGRIVRIASAVGARKALEIEKAARQAGLQVANPRKIKPKEKKGEGKPAEKGGKEEKKAQKPVAAQAKTPEAAPKPAKAEPMPEPRGPQPPPPSMKGGSA